MKTKYLVCVLLLPLAVMFVSCNKEKETNADDPTEIEGTLTNYSDCKQFTLNDTKSLFQSDESCIEYIYDPETNILSVVHVNSGFNCCPEILFVKVYISNDTIIIDESEQEQGCFCECLYDIFIEIPEIEDGIYFIKVIEPYCGNQEKLEFEIDLTMTIHDIYCVERTQYPWGI